MNNVNMQTLIRIVLGCMVLFILSPFIFGIFGIIAKIILWFVLAVVLIITLSIMYLKHKINKSEDGFYSVKFGDKKETVDTSESDSFEEDEDDDFNTSNFIDVDYKDADED